MSSPTNAPYPRRWSALAVLLVANIMNLMDVTIIIVGMPSIQREFNASSSALEWVMAAYVIGLALALLPFGRLGDAHDRRKIFLWGVGGFTAASVLCGLAPSISMLIAARAIQGITAGAMAPQVLAILHVIFPPAEKGRVFSLFALSTGLASVLGSIAGGVILAANVADLGWRPVFLVNLPIGLGAILLGARLIPAMPGNRDLRFDKYGLALFSTTVLLIIFPLVEGQQLGWPLWLLAMLICAVPTALMFRWTQKSRAKTGLPQLVPVELISNGRFVAGVLMALLYFSAAPGLFFMIAIFGQTGFGLSPLPAGLIGIPFPVGVVLASTATGRLGNRAIYQRLVIGCVILMLGLLLLGLTISAVTAPINVWAFLPAFLISGIGFGISVGPLFQSVLSSVNVAHAGAGAGTLQTFQQIGSAFGIAVVGQLFFSQLNAMTGQGAATQQAYISAALHGLSYVIFVFFVVAVNAFRLKPEERPAEQKTSAPLPLDI